MPPLIPLALSMDMGWISGGMKAVKQRKGFLDGAWRGLITGTISGGLSYIGGGSMPFGMNLLLGSASGGLSGAIDAALWGEDIGKGALRGSLWGAVATTLTSENLSNLLNGEGFNNNSRVFDNMMNRGADKQGILDYFGFEGEYSPNFNAPKYIETDSYYGLTDRITQQIHYGDMAFSSYDNLKAIFHKEVYHLNRVINDKIALQNDPRSLKVAPEERLGFIHAFKNKGLYSKSSIDFMSQISYYQNKLFEEPSTFFRDKRWYYFIYKIPRRW